MHMHYHMLALEHLLVRCGLPRIYQPWVGSLCGGNGSQPIERHRAPSIIFKDVQAEAQRSYAQYKKRACSSRPPGLSFVADFGPESVLTQYLYLYLLISLSFNSTRHARITPLDNYLMFNVKDLTLETTLRNLFSLFKYFLYL